MYEGRKKNHWLHRRGLNQFLLHISCVVGPTGKWRAEEEEGKEGVVKFRRFTIAF